MALLKNQSGMTLNEMMLATAVTSIGALALGTGAFYLAETTNKVRDNDWKQTQNLLVGTTLSTKDGWLVRPNGDPLNIGGDSKVDVEVSLVKRPKGQKPVPILTHGAPAFGDRRLSVKLLASAVRVEGFGGSDGTPTYSPQRRFEGSVVVTLLDGANEAEKRAKGQYVPKAPATRIPVTLYFDSAGDLITVGTRSTEKPLTAEDGSSNGHSEYDCIAVGGQPVDLGGPAVGCRVPNFDATPGMKVATCPYQWKAEFDNKAAPDPLETNVLYDPPEGPPPMKTGGGGGISTNLGEPPPERAPRFKGGSDLVTRVDSVASYPGKKLSEWSTAGASWTVGKLWGTYPDTKKLMEDINADRARQSGILAGKISKCTPPSLEELKCPPGYEAMDMKDGKKACVYEFSNGCPDSMTYLAPPSIVSPSQVCQPQNWACGNSKCTVTVGKGLPLPIDYKCKTGWKLTGVTKRKLVQTSFPCPKDPDAPETPDPEPPKICTEEQWVSYTEQGCVPEKTANGCPKNDGTGFLWVDLKPQLGVGACRPNVITGECPVGWYKELLTNICKPKQVPMGTLKCPEPLDAAMAAWKPHPTQWQENPDGWNSQTGVLCY